MASRTLPSNTELTRRTCSAIHDTTKCFRDGAAFMSSIELSHLQAAEPRHLELYVDSIVRVVRQLRRLGVDVSRLMEGPE
jgi:hypothetical protein